MSGLKPCVVGLIGAAVINIAITVLFPDGLTSAALSSAFSERRPYDKRCLFYRIRFRLSALRACLRYRC